LTPKIFRPATENLQHTNISSLCQAPDTFAKVDLGAEPSWQTKTKDNTVNPSWNETHDFVVSDFHQCIKVHLFDKDVNSDDEIGMGITTKKSSATEAGRNWLLS
jgi:Ca2+-dependent lipid-binding protein